jgi:hypothetical protein
VFKDSARQVELCMWGQTKGSVRRNEGGEKSGVDRDVAIYQHEKSKKR